MVMRKMGKGMNVVDISRWLAIGWGQVAVGGLSWAVVRYG